MRRSHLILLVAAVFICALSLGSAFAGDKKSEKTYRLKVGAGFYSTSTDDSKTNVAEYDDTGGSPTGLFGYTGSFGKNFIDLNAKYTTSDDNAGNLDLDISRVVRFKVDYSRFIHRTRHDPLFQDILKGKMIVNPIFSSDNELEGAQVWKYTDQQPGKNYQIYRQLTRMNAKVTVPSFPALTFHAGWRNEIRHGWRQGTLMTGKCTPCHIVGYGNRIDQNTDDLSVGATLKVGIMTVDYTYTDREFNNEASTQRIHYDPVVVPGNPGRQAVFANRLNLVNVDDTRNLIPDSDKKTHVIKLHADLPGETTAYGSYVNSTMEDDYNDLDVDQQTYNLRLTKDFMKRRLTVSGRLRYINIDSDDANVVVNEHFAPFDPAYHASDNFDFVRKSAIDREEFTGNLDAAFRLNRCTTIRAGYEYDNIDRDNFAVTRSGDTETTTNTLKLAVNGRPSMKWKYRVAYTYKNIDDPFTNVGGKCETVRDLGVGTTAYYKVFGSQYRYQDASNQPESSHEIKLSTTYMPKTNMSINGLFQYQKQDNDHSNWDLDRYMAGVNLWFMPMKKLSFSMGYNYQYEKDSTGICTDLFAG